MKLIKKYVTNNVNYKNNKEISVKRLVLHSVGTPQPSPEVFVRLWDDYSVKYLAHAVVGTEAGYEVIPCMSTRGKAIKCAHVGDANGESIGVELTEPATIEYHGIRWEDLDPENTKSHVLKTYKNAVDIFAQMCTFHRLNPLEDGVILSHKECHARGLGTNHGDVEHLWDAFGLTMDQFRKDVKASIGDVSTSVLVLGDSIAEGLAQYLLKNVDNSSYKITNAGVVGEQISSCTRRAQKYKDYDVVVLVTSTNNYGESSIQKNYESLVSTVREGNPTAAILCVNSPGVTAEDTEYSHVDNEVIKAHNSEIQNICKSHNTTYIDFYDILGDQETASHAYRSNDGLHPNDAGYYRLSLSLDLESPSSTTGVNNLWQWPVPGYDESDITSRMGTRGDGVHKGIDIAAPTGVEVVATRSGRVVSVYKDCQHTNTRGDTCGGGYGNNIYIDHGDGYSSRYAHLTDVYVDSRQEVTAGQVIGTIGSTGDSSGPHLHFEILYDRVHVNPEDYISSKSPTSVSPSYSPGSSSTTVGDDRYADRFSALSGDYYGTVEAGGTTIGQRVSGVTEQPIHAFINIYVGDNRLLLATSPARPNIIQSFEYTKLDGAGETAIFTVYDPNWEEIEAALSANFDNIYIQYGYYGTGFKSKLVKHRLLNYNLTFEASGPIISVTTVTEGVVDNLVPRTIELDTNNPTEAVKKICKALGYTVLDENFDPSTDVLADNPFNLLAEYPIKYIQEVIVPQAAGEGEEIFRFTLDPDNVAHFKRVTYHTTNTDTLRTYIYGKGYDSSVIDFSVDIKAIFGGAGDFNVATEYRTSAFGTKDKHFMAKSLDSSSTMTEATGDITHTSKDQSQLIVDSAGYTPTQMSNKLYYLMKSSIHDAYEATLTIVGDPTIDHIHERYVRVINMTNKGFLHHTSGVYWIKGVTDSIQGGEMTTSLKLVRNATAGDIDGVEIINPKYFIK